MIKKLQNVFYVAGDFTRTRRFYESVLGLELKFSDGERWVQFNVAGANFAIGSAGEVPDGATGGITVFEVESLDALRTKLVADGIEVLAERDMGGHGRTFAVKDPSGNFVQFFERPKSIAKL